VSSCVVYAYPCTPVKINLLSHRVNIDALLKWNSRPRTLLGVVTVWKLYTQCVSIINKLRAKSLSQLDFMYCHKKENDEVPYSRGVLHDIPNMGCISSGECCVTLYLQTNYWCKGECTRIVTESQCRVALHSNLILKGMQGKEDCIVDTHVCCKGK